MLCNMSLLLRPSRVGFLFNQPLSIVLLHMAHLARVKACDGLQQLGDILTIALSFLLTRISFTLEIGSKG